jgi:hypothetical protein
MNEINLLTEWTHFDQVTSIQGIDKPGVYLLAHFEKNPESSRVSMVDDIVYIGETTRQTIGARLGQFAQSAFKRKIGHSGGWTFSDEFLGSQEIGSVPDNLYVSILPVDRGEKERKATSVPTLPRKNGITR